MKKYTTTAFEDRIVEVMLKAPERDDAVFAYLELALGVPRILKKCMDPESEWVPLLRGLFKAPADARVVRLLNFVLMRGNEDATTVFSCFGRNVLRSSPPFP